jgi:hypothetical protein
MLSRKVLAIGSALTFAVTAVFCAVEVHPWWAGLMFLGFGSFCLLGWREFSSDSRDIQKLQDEMTKKDDPRNMARCMR